MSKNDLLKEAIADAKAVRETAIANAKLALEEAFTPKLQSMLSTKIAEEMEDELEEDEELEMDVDTAEEPAAEMEDEEVSAEDAEMEEADEEDYQEGTYEGEEEEEDLELESIIRELESEEGLEEEEEEEAVAESYDESEEAELEEDEEVMDLDEIIKSLTEEDEEEVMEEDDMEGELEEAYSTIKSLKNTINEVNLLNSKLLFSNKLFRMHSLSESQKMNVIETFDRAVSVREVKLVYTTLAESLVPTTSRKRTVTEGFASKSTKSTKPSKNVIVESSNFATRMQKLAGL
tara:strand:+ start:1276 stop:2148 length:873 start_codon:yes stop_codon:yes gene_type:complete